MTPQEKKLIEQLFARLEEASAQPRDADADRLISRGVAEQPNAPYLLVQTVLIQDMALGQAQQRISDLEKQLAEAGAGEPAPPQATRFLGRMLGRGSGQAAGPWQRMPSAASAAGPAPASGSTQGVYSPPPGSMAASPMPGAGSDFLHAAAATALGVAGGQMLFQGIESLFGHHAGGMLGGQPLQPAISETVTNNYYGDGDGRSAANDGARGDATRDNDTQASDSNADQDQDATDQGLDGSDMALDNDFGSDDTDLV